MVHSLLGSMVGSTDSGDVEQTSRLRVTKDQSSELFVNSVQMFTRPVAGSTDYIIAVISVWMKNRLPHDLPKKNLYPSS